MKQHITVGELALRIEQDANLRMIDVRAPGEFAAGHVPGAVNIPLEQVEARIADLGPGPIALLCQSGRRAGMACDLLSGAGKNLLIVDGGTKGWVDAGKSIVSTTNTRWSLERQVRLTAGLIVLISSVLAATVQPGWLYVSMFVGAGLSFAGVTDICGMGILLAKMPWNRSLPTFSNEVKA